MKEYHKVSKSKGIRNLFKNFYFSIEQLNLEWDTDENGWHDNDIYELFEEENLKEIPYYCYDYGNSYAYYLDMGYEVELGKLKRKIKLLNSLYDYESDLLDTFTSNKFKVNDAKKIIREFKKCLKNLDVAKMDFEDNHDDPSNLVTGDFFKYFIYKKGMNEVFEEDDVPFFLSQAHPFLLLNYLLANKKNEKLKLQLRASTLPPKQKAFLTVFVEGTSDVKLLNKIFSIKGKDVKNFFHFTTPHPKGSGNGAGSSKKMFLDLNLSIKSGHYLFLFDNDVAGNKQYEECLKEIKNNYIHLSCLPNLLDKHKKDIICIDKKGETINDIDINKRAVAIEAFLDLRFGFLKDIQPTIVIGEKEQGKFKGKEKYSNSFLMLKEEHYSSYNFEKIEYLINFFIDTLLKINT